MESLRRFFYSNSLFLLTLTASLAGHASLGWLGRGESEGPRLEIEESGRTSVAVQWIAQPPPESLPPRESIEPLLLDRYEPVETASASPATVPLAPETRRETVPVEPALDGTEPLLAALPPELRLPPRPRAEPIAHSPRTRASEPISEDRPTPRRPGPQTVQPDDAPVEVPETLLSEESSGADVPPAFVSRPLPHYPEDLLLRRIEGVVRLLVTVQRDGRVAAAQVHQSSGYAEMDQSALRTVRQWIFTPARRGGMPIEQTVIVPVRFQIRSGD